MNFKPKNLVSLSEQNLSICYKTDKISDFMESDHFMFYK